MSTFISKTNPPAQQDNGHDSWETEEMSTFILKVDPPAPKKKKKKKRQFRAGRVLDQEPSKWHSSHTTTGVPAGYYELDDIDCRDIGFVRSKKTEVPKKDVPQPEDPWPELVQKQTPKLQDNNEKKEDVSPSPQPPVVSWAQDQQTTSGLESVTAVVNEATAAPDMTRLLLEENHRLKDDLARACRSLQVQADMFGQERHHILMGMKKLQDDLHKAKEGQESLKKQLEEERSMLQETTIETAEELTKAKHDLLQKEREWEEERLQLLLSQMDQRAKHQATLNEANDTIEGLKQQLTSLKAKHQEDTSSIEASLLQAWTDQQGMKKETSELQEQLAKVKQDGDRKAHFLADQVTETITLKADVNQAKEDLRNKTQQWEEERSSFSADLKEAEARLERERQQQEETSVLLQKQKETIRSLNAAHKKKVSLLEAALRQASTDQEEMETRWEDEKSDLLVQHQKETSKLLEELAKAKQDLVCQQAEQEMEEQQQERTIHTSRQSLEEVEEQSSGSSDGHRESLGITEGQRAGAQGRKTNCFTKWFQRVFRRKTSAED